MLPASKTGTIALRGMIITFFLIVHLQHLQAQEGCKPVITVQFQEQNLEKILDSLSSLSGLRFSFNSQLISQDDITSISFNNLDICSALDSLLVRFGLTWTKVQNQIVIIAKPELTTLTHLEKPLAAQITVTGKVIDIVDQEPIPYAYIRIVGKSTGTITNNDGDFVFKFQSGIDREIISVSCIGYKTIIIPLVEFVSGTIWKMQRESILLKEVLIRSNDPKTIIRKAIEAIPKNYRLRPVSQTGFYRETLKKNSSYVVLSEAVVNIYKTSYNRPFQFDQVKVFKGRKTEDKNQYDTVLFKVQGGLFNSLMLDIVKNLPSFMAESDFQYYDYKMGLIQTINGENAYTIEFDQKDGIEEPLYKGKLFINVNSLAILGTEFSISPKAINNAASMLVRRSPLNIKVKPISVDYLVNYDYTDGKWQLNHIRLELIMRVRKKYNLFNSVYTSVSEMVVTETDTMNVRTFRFSEVSRSNEVFIEHLGQYDTSFWGEYNYIKPEEKIEETLRRLFPKTP
jgi:hypothetical protein